MATGWDGLANSSDGTATGAIPSLLRVPRTPALPLADDCAESSSSEVLSEPRHFGPGSRRWDFPSVKGPSRGSLKDALTVAGLPSALRNAVKGCEDDMYSKTSLPAIRSRTK
eukprot:5435613-Amphidinium_carterae.1